MRALLYLTKRSMINNLKKAVKKPLTLLVVLACAAYAVFLAVMLAVIAVTPMEMEHTDAAMVHSVTALMTGNLVNKSNADKLTYRQLETSAYERKLISKSVFI